MQLCDIFLRLGEENFQQNMRSVSMGKLKTYQLFDSLKTRLHMHKLNSEALRKAAPRVWARVNEHDAGGQQQNRELREQQHEQVFFQQLEKPRLGNIEAELIINRLRRRRDVVRLAVTNQTFS